MRVSAALRAMARLFASAWGRRYVRSFRAGAAVRLIYVLIQNIILIRIVPNTSHIRGYCPTLATMGRQSGASSRPFFVSVVHYEYNGRGYAVLPGVDIRCHAC